MAIPFGLRWYTAGTGSAVWDDPHAGAKIQRFIPLDRDQGPMVGIVHLGGAKPTPSVLQQIVVTVGEDLKAGRYGACSIFITSEDEATRNVIGDIAAQQNVAVFVSSSAMTLEDAEPVGDLTAKDRETLDLVLKVGGTVTAMEFARSQGIEQTAAGNRLVALHKKGYLQRVPRPHPTGDLFVDPRSVRFDEAPRTLALRAGST
jgi:hypothetical protein